MPLTSQQYLHLYGIITKLLRYSHIAEAYPNETRILEECSDIAYDHYYTLRYGHIYTD